MENNLSLLENKGLKIKSVELVDIINQFRALEGKRVELQHKDLMKKIRKEVEILKSLDLDNGGNFSPVDYTDSKGEKRPCYELNRDGMLQMLNSESALVRYKTIEYINTLETEFKNTQLLLAGQKIAHLEATVDRFEKLTEDARQHYKLSHKKKLDYNRLIKSVSESKEDEEDIKGFTFTLLKVEKWEELCIDDHDKIVETIKVAARLFSLRKFEEITLF